MPPAAAEPADFLAGEGGHNLLARPPLGLQSFLCGEPSGGGQPHGGR